MISNISHIHHFQHLFIRRLIGILLESGSYRYIFVMILIPNGLSTITDLYFSLLLISWFDALSFPFIQSPYTAGYHFNIYSYLAIQKCGFCTAKDSKKKKRSPYFQCILSLIFSFLIFVRSKKQYSLFKTILSAMICHWMNARKLNFIYKINKNDNSTTVWWMSVVLSRAMNILHNHTHMFSFINTHTCTRTQREWKRH